ncbi:similar to Saccharomyces cerevisiae YGL246C RAI1 Nuclear protein with decapping endonuclease activity targeted toward mRNAs with unmethylated 7-methylguanosine cap structures [Maudiozyma saulgeensis]|uniref:Decapping nuclease n=1 Tax=Maudiozyma saulgeensis TaxID=1789683 RepID=A0A1X7RBA4_9SACH|nr:similar to Saccharomyces cerevisiae YGL246C RAI1 Nuclear protein with decapping endonuclease activity targeted toward mRNAs with unmethylated 7-methylguanosine cap structures [Kazachstania saulgeensis]
MPVISRLPFSRSENSHNILKPKEIACYSRTSDSKIIVDSDKNLRYYYFPDEQLVDPISLAAGRGNFEDIRSKIDDVCSLHGLLQTIQTIEEKKNSRLKVNIITFRGIFRKLISAAFEGGSRYQEPLDLRLVIFDEQIFIKEVPKREGDRHSTVDLNTFTGYKFETLTTLEKPVNLCTRDEIESRPSRIVNNGDEFVTVVGTGIGSCRLVLGAEVDGIFDFKDENNKCKNISHYVELKCSKDIRSERDANNFANKLFRTWLQCFLVGITRIIYGFRDENYKLISVEEYSTDNIISMLGKYNPKLAENCSSAVGWYGKITEWLLTIQTRYSQKETPESIIPFKLTVHNQELQLIDISTEDDEYDAIVNGESVLFNEFKEWRRKLRQQNL